MICVFTILDPFCIDLYEQIQTSFVIGPIVWYALKPMLRGHIFYAPNTTEAKDIMQEVCNIILHLEIEPFFV